MDSTTPTPASPLTLGQRIMADTPVFFKVVQILAALLLLAAAIMTKFNIGTADAHTLMATIGFTALGVSQFAAKEATTLSGGLTLGNIMEALSDLSGEVQTVKGQVAAAPALPDIADAVTNVINAIKAPAADTAPPAQPASNAKPSPDLTIVT